MFDRRLVQYFDWGLLGIVLLLGCIGILIVYSAVGSTNYSTTVHLKQSLWFLLGLGVMVFCFLFSYKLLFRMAPFIYVIGVFLLVCVMFVGKDAGGSSRWLNIGPVAIQPSELMKLAIIIMLARYYSQRINDKGLTLQELFIPMILVGIPFALVVEQPDLGTAMLIMLISASMTIFVRIERKSFIALMIMGIGVMYSGWFFLKDYQKKRIFTFLNPDSDPLGSGYHITQSKIAIGSGMLSGKGFFKGTQNYLSFLPEHHTDFIFSVLAEELGFNGAIILLFIFLLLIIWGLDIAYRCREPFGMILCVGIISMISWQVFVNMGMVMGLMPVVGVPLPFISYGGSSMITTMICIGLLLNVSMRRFMFE
ncbi:MAG: rod shape-determining protein RodA [Desulfobacterales bacterium]|nr:rod shape-determining protein RodA [Desulfobacterales bacterium]